MNWLMWTDSRNLWWRWWWWITLVFSQYPGVVPCSTLVLSQYPGVVPVHRVVATRNIICHFWVGTVSRLNCTLVFLWPLAQVPACLSHMGDRAASTGHLVHTTPAVSLSDKWCRVPGVYKEIVHMAPLWDGYLDKFQVLGLPTLAGLLSIQLDGHSLITSSPSHILAVRCSGGFPEHESLNNLSKLELHSFLPLGMPMSTLSSSSI